MKYTVTNNYDDVDMTGLVGYVNTTYADLVEAFGKPLSGSGDGKVNSEWIIKFANGEVATIYDWKEYRSISETEKISWHIGGNSRSITEQAKREMLG